MNVEQARFNMIEQQIRPWEVLDPTVLTVLSELRREQFVLPEYVDLAFADTMLPLGFGESMAPPRVEARLAQAAAVNLGELVLEVGTGSGFMANILAALGGRVTSIEIRPDFVARAQRNLAAANAENVEVIEGDGIRGWPARGPYNAIVLSGSVAEFDIDEWMEQLLPNGRLVAVVGTGPIMEATLIQRVGNSTTRQVSLFDTVLPPLVTTETASSFVF